MAKFENSLFNKLWDSREGRQIMTKILNDGDLIRSNHTFWREKFLVDPQMTPTDAKGKATFISTLVKRQGGALMDMRAPLGDSVPADQAETKYYTGVIPDFISQGYYEQAMERLYKEELFEQYGDAKLLAAYATTELQRMLDSANQTLSHLSAQILSTGKCVYNFGQGIKGNVLDANVPAENRMSLPAGSAVWSDVANAKPLNDILNLVEAANNIVGDSNITWQVEIPRDIYVNYLLENAQVKDWVRYILSLNFTSVPAANNIKVTSAQFNEAIAHFEGMPKIVIVEESQKDLGTSSVVHGWDAGKIVIRPLGYAGYIRYTSPLDKKVFEKGMYNNVVECNFTPVLGGIAAIRNKVTANGDFKAWHSDVIMSAIPTLDEFIYHFIVDTTAVSE